MKYLPLLILSLVLLVLISGCTGLPNVFGSNVISLQKTIIREEPKDAVVVPNIVTLPNPPFLPDQDVIVSMIVENRDELKNAENLRIDMFNAPTFKTLSGQLCNQQLYSGGVVQGQCGNGACESGESFIVCPSDCKEGEYVPTQFDISKATTYSTCQPDFCGLQSCTLLPGEQRQVKFSLRAPSQQEIANIRTETELNIKTKYDFDASLVYIVPVVNVDEIVRLQTEGKKLTIEESRLHGSGPVLIDVEVLGAQYVLSSSDTDFSRNTQPQKSIINFKVKNTGSGSMENSLIPAASNLLTASPAEIENQNIRGRRGMAITFPAEFAVKPPDNFQCQQSGLNTVCVNTKDIQIFNDESRVSMRFEIVPQKLPIGTPFRSYQVKAFVWYNYELRSKVTVSINTFQNV